MMKPWKFFVWLAGITAVFWYTADYWFPPLDSFFSDEKQSGKADRMSSVLSMVLAYVLAAIGAYQYLVRRSVSESCGSQPTPSINNYVQDRPYEPTPLDLSAKPLDAEQCPYLGLSAFRKDDAHLFFGRHREIREALAYLGAPLHPQDGEGEQRCRWLQIEGNSGAGKSSLVNAGMLPQIERGVLAQSTGFSQWQVIGPMMPGETPLRRLAEVLEQAFVPEGQRNSLKRQQDLEADSRSLSYSLADARGGNADTAFLLVVDQFEELFTFSDKEEKLHFDAQLTGALEDKSCPLFVISTVRIDFLDGFEQLPKLSELYNARCKRYLLKTISQEGLLEAIERPAALAGLDVSEVATALQRDASGEVGALPLVENALRILWDQREGNRLSGALYVEKGGIIGLLEEQADTSLTRLESLLPGGKKDALELFLALTRIHDEGRHSRRRLPIAEARRVAGGKKADPERGQRIIDWLTGHTAMDNQPGAAASLRLLTTVGEQDSDQAVELIHETLIRAKRKDSQSGKLIGYWRTLYNYIEQNRDRGFYRDQLSRQAKAWSAARGMGRWRKLAGWRDLVVYRPLRPAENSAEARYLQWSWARAWAQGSVAMALAAFAGELYWWTLSHGLPPEYMLMQQKFRLMERSWLVEPLPELVEIPAPADPVRLGDRDPEFIKKVANQPEYPKNFGLPTTEAAIGQPFRLGKYEVTYEQYDYYVWRNRRASNPPSYPSALPGESARGRRAVTNVSWNDAQGYLRWLSEHTGGEYRLPTEAEWEYAARAGTDTGYWWGEEPGKGRANCDGCGSPWDNQKVAPVGSFLPNAFGIYDTVGNVWEWTCSEWKVPFDGSENRCLDPFNSSGRRAIRGGSWGTTTDYVRSSVRNGDMAGSRNIFVGFRVLRADRTD